MCLAIPARVVTVEADAQTAVVALGNVKKRISIALLDQVSEGDYVLVHVGFALNVVSEEEATRTLEMMKEAGLAPEESAA